MQLEMDGDEDGQLKEKRNHRLLEFDTSLENLPIVSFRIVEEKVVLPKQIIIYKMFFILNIQKIVKCFHI